MINIMKGKIHNKKTKGFSLVEIMIGAAVMLALWVGVFWCFSIVTQFAERDTSYVQAGFLLEEGSEALRSIRDAGWTSNIAALTVGNTYYLTYNSTSNLWTSSTVNTFVESKFQRSFVLSSVSRDSNFNVVSSGGTVDSGSRKATITVSWKNGNATTSQILETYLFNDFNN